MHFIENMARICFTTQFLLLASASFLLASDTCSMKVSQRHGAAGVSMLIDGGKYTFNFTAARAACLFRNVTIATRAQMERAVQHGLETCKFGWIAEQIAVIPRLTADQNCGKGKTGVVTWLTSTDKTFGAFCFNASDLEETPNKTTASPQNSTFSTTPTALAQTSAPLVTTTKPPPSRKPRTTEAPEQTSRTSSSLLYKTHSTRVPVTSTTPKTLPTQHISTPLPHIITSKPAVSSLIFSTSVHASDFSVSSESRMPKPVRPAKPSLGDAPTALIILGIIILLFTAAGFVWFCKLNMSTFWNPGQQLDDIEAEMWKHTDSEMDLHSHHEGEEELDRKYSSDITLCVNPDIKTNSV